jgi:hypothetical protein
MGHVEYCFGPFGDNISVSAREVYGFAPNVPQAQKSFSMHPMELLDDMGHLESHFSLFGAIVSIGAR